METRRNGNGRRYLRAGFPPKCRTVMAGLAPRAPAAEDGPEPDAKDRPEPTKYVITIGLETHVGGPVDAAATVAARLQVQAPEIDGTVTPSLGFGAWGVEPGAQVTTTAALEPAEMRKIVANLMASLGCTLAYVEYGGEAYEWTDYGLEHRIEGFRAS